MSVPLVSNSPIHRRGSSESVSGSWNSEAKNTKQKKAGRVVLEFRIQGNKQVRFGDEKGWKGSGPDPFPRRSFSPVVQDDTPRHVTCFRT